MGCDGGAWPAALADERLGLIKDLHDRNEAAAFDHKVDTAAAMTFVESPWAKHSGVELAGGCEDGVTDHFCFEASWGKAPEKFVGGVNGGFFFGRFAALEPSCTQENLSMKCLDVPAAADEFLGEEIEEFWMGWECPLKSEVIRSSNDPFSEVMVPESVDSDTGEKVACSILRVGNPIGETASAIAGTGPVNGRLFFPMISG